MTNTEVLDTVSAPVGDQSIKGADETAALEMATREAEMIRKLAELIKGPPVNNYMTRQIQLAVEKFYDKNSGKKLDKSKRDLIMGKWHESDLSKKWKELVFDPRFKTHKKFQGSYANVTLEDLEIFTATGNLPAED